MLSEILSGNYSWFIALIIAITIHEFSHALAAESLGDPTPRLMKRLTLNPLAHLDPLGTFFMLITRFGWGKPVIFDPFNLKDPRRDAAIISLAGPVSNILLAFVISLLIRFLPIGAVSLGPFLIATKDVIGFLLPIVFINVSLAIFNLIPIHPLDGFKIVGGVLPDSYVKEWYNLERYGVIFLLFLLLPFGPGASILQSIITPPITFLLQLMLGFRIY